MDWYWFISRIHQPFIAPLLSYGVGSMLFQIAALCMYARDSSVPCYVAFWSHPRSNSSQFKSDSVAFEKHGTLHAVFPKLECVTSRKDLILFKSDTSFSDRPMSASGQYMPMQDLFDFRVTPFVSGYFFHHQCLYHSFNCPVFMCGLLCM